MHALLTVFNKPYTCLHEAIKSLVLAAPSEVYFPLRGVSGEVQECSIHDPIQNPLGLHSTALQSGLTVTEGRGHETCSQKNTSTWLDDTMTVIQLYYVPGSI